MPTIEQVSAVPEGYLLLGEQQKLSFDPNNGGDTFSQFVSFNASRDGMALKFTHEHTAIGPSEYSVVVEALYDRVSVSRNRVSIVCSVDRLREDQSFIALDTSANDEFNAVVPYAFKITVDASVISGGKFTYSDRDMYILLQAYQAPPSPSRIDRDPAPIFPVHPANTATAVPDPGIYIVKPGDYLRGLATKFYGDQMKWPIIYKANKSVIGPNPDLLHPGQRLNIPAG